MTKQEKLEAAIRKAEDMRLAIAKMHSSVVEEKFAPRKNVEAVKDDVSEIGCDHFFLHGRRFDVVKWHEKNRSAIVSVDGEERAHKWPFHTGFHVAVNFSAPEAYMAKHSNCERLHTDKGVYIVNEFGAWYSDGRYLPMSERGFNEEDFLILKREKWIM